MRSPRVAIALLIVAAVAAMSGCAQTPSASAPTTSQSPGPSASPGVPFATDDEAFAAAEKSYRATIDAINDMDFDDPSTFTAMYNMTTGEEYRLAKKTFSRLHAERSKSTGMAVVTLVVPYEISHDRSDVSLIVCLDVNDVVLLDSSGEDITPSDRPDMQSLVIHLSAVDGKYRVEKVRNRQGGPSCE